MQGILPFTRGRHLAWLAVVALLAAGQLLAQTDRDGARERPRAINKPTLTYLPEKRAALLFGGYQQGGALGESWLLEDGCWRQLHIPGPPARGAHGAAYDAGRRRVVLFGGAAGDGRFADTWEFDGERWEQRSVAGPSARAMLRMTYDERRKRVLLFGGSNSPTGPHPREVWQWDGTAWTVATESGPPPRFESALVYDTKREVAVAFGGNQAVDRRFAEGALGDTWLLRGNAWQELSGPGPGKRDHHGMAFHAARGVAVMVGGSSGRDMLGDTWIFDGQHWSEQTGPNGPPARGGVPAMTYDSHRQRIIMYGGWGPAGPLTDLWAWDGKWSPLETSHCVSSR